VFMPLQGPESQWTFYRYRTVCEGERMRSKRLYRVTAQKEGSLQGFLQRIP